MLCVVAQLFVSCFPQGGTTSENEDFAMPILVKEKPRQRSGKKNTTPELTINISTSVSVVLDRIIVEPSCVKNQISKSNIDTFDERLINILEKISSGEAAPALNKSTAESQSSQESINTNALEESSESCKSRSDTESSSKEKSRGDLKTRINIKRCTIEAGNKSDQATPSDSTDNKDSQGSGRLLRSKSCQEPKLENKKQESNLENKKQESNLENEKQESNLENKIKDSNLENNNQVTNSIENKKHADGSNDEETEVVSRKQSLRNKQVAKDNTCLKLKIKTTDLKENESQSDAKLDLTSAKENKEESAETNDVVANDDKTKAPTEKKRKTRASVAIEEPSSNSIASDDKKQADETENIVSVKSLRSRQRVSYVEAVEEQFATFDSSESESESVYVKPQEKGKKKKQPKSVKSSVSSTKETQVTENIFDCNVLINNIQINKFQIKQTEIRQNVKFNKKQRSVSCENKDVLINKKSLRSVKTFCHTEEIDGEEKEKSQSLSNLDQITLVGQSNPTSSFNNEFIDFLKNTVRPETTVNTCVPLPVANPPSLLTNVNIAGSSPPESPTSSLSVPIEKTSSENLEVSKSDPIVEKPQCHNTAESTCTESEETNTLSETTDTPVTIDTIPVPVNLPLLSPVGTAVQTELTDIPTLVGETNVAKAVDAIPIEPSVSNASTNCAEKSFEVDTQIIPMLPNIRQIPTSSQIVNNIENVISDVIKASCGDTVIPSGLNSTHNTIISQNKKPLPQKQTRKRTQIDKDVHEEPFICKKIKSSFDDQPIPFTELMIPEVVLTVNDQELPVSVGTMCEPNTITSIENKSIAKATKHVDTCEKSVSTDVTKIQYSIYPEASASPSPVAVENSNINKDMYTYFDNFGKHLTLYGNSVNSQKSNYYDTEASKELMSQGTKLKTTTPLFSSSTSTSSIRSVIQTKSVSSVSITPINLSPASASHRTQITSLPSEDMPIDLSKKSSNIIDTDSAKNRAKGVKARSDIRSTSTTPDCLAYRDSTTPESVCKIGSSSTTPDSVYSCQETVPRSRNKTKATAVYEVPRQSPQKVQMMHTRLWDMQDLPYHNMLLNENPTIPQAAIQTLTPSEYAAQRNLFIANQMYVSALQAFQDAANSNTCQKTPFKKRGRTDAIEVGRRKKLRDVMTNVPVLSYEQLQQANTGLERRLEENVFRYQTSTSSAQSTSVIQRTEVSSDQSTLTFVHNTPDDDCL